MSGVRQLDGDGRRANPEIIFSLVESHVWASWLGSSVMVRLGRLEGVASMMRDFLAHCDLADRLEELNSSIQLDGRPQPPID